MDNTIIKKTYAEIVSKGKEIKIFKTHIVFQGLIQKNNNELNQYIPPEILKHKTGFKIIIQKKNFNDIFDEYRIIIHELFLKCNIIGNYIPASLFIKPQQIYLTCYPYDIFSLFQMPSQLLNKTLGFPLFINNIKGIKYELLKNIWIVPKYDIKYSAKLKLLSIIFCCSKKLAAKRNRKSLNFDCIEKVMYYMGNTPKYFYDPSGKKGINNIESLIDPVINDKRFYTNIGNIEDIINIDSYYSIQGLIKMIEMDVMQFASIDDKYYNEIKTFCYLDRQFNELEEKFKKMYSNIPSNCQYIQIKQSSSFQDKYLTALLLEELKKFVIKY